MVAARSSWLEEKIRNAKEQVIDESYKIVLIGKKRRTKHFGIHAFKDKDIIKTEFTTVCVSYKTFFSAIDTSSGISQ